MMLPIQHTKFKILIAFCLLFILSCLYACKGAKSSQQEAYPLLHKNEQDLRVIHERSEEVQSKEKDGNNLINQENTKTYKLAEGTIINDSPANVRKVIERHKVLSPSSTIHPSIEENVVIQPLEVAVPSHKYYLLDDWEFDMRYGSHKAGQRPFDVKPSYFTCENGSTSIEMMLCRPANGYRGYYEAESVRKDRITLHFTVGNIKSDIDVLTRQKPGKSKWRNSVPFVVARDGTIYQLFDPKYWSHHLGNGSIGGNQNSSSRSIAIELSNYGPLIKRGNNLETIYSRKSSPNYVDVYCTLADTDKYIKLDTPFNGYQYFAKFTDQQYDSLVRLLRYLTERFDIPRKFLPEHKRYRASTETAFFKGINTHLNFRATGKWDIGPAFDWNRVISGVSATNYKPLSEQRGVLIRGKE